MRRRGIRSRNGIMLYGGGGTTHPKRNVILSLLWSCRGRGIGINKIFNVCHAINFVKWYCEWCTWGFVSERGMPCSVPSWAWASNIWALLSYCWFCVKSQFVWKPSLLGIVSLICQLLWLSSFKCHTCSFK